MQSRQFNITTEQKMNGIKKIILLLSVLLIFVLYSGCDFTGDYDDEDDGNNPGTSFLPPESEITELTNGVPAEGYIEVEDEEDWYKIEAYAGQMIKLTLAMGGNDVDPKISSYIANEEDALELDDWNWSDTNGSDGVNIDTGQWLALEDNIYYFKICDNDGEYSSVPYIITVEVTNNPDSNEPLNDEHMGAVQLSNGVGSQAYIATRYDVDWYKIEASEGQMLRITLTMDGNDVDPSIYGYTLSGMETNAVSKWSWDDSNGTDGVSLDSGQITASEDNIYYFRISDDDSEFSSVPYIITIEVTNNPDSNEPGNDEYTGAAQLSNGTGKQAYIATRWDVDWFKIEAYAGQMLRITLTMGGTDVDSWIVGYTLSGLQTSAVSGWNWDDENGTDGVSLDSGQITVPEDNTYYFSVMDRDSWGSIDQGNDYSSVPYIITIEVTNNPDSNEPGNDEYTGAAQLSNGTGKQAYIATRWDVDWFKIEAYAGQMLRITLTMGGTDVDSWIVGYTLSGLQTSAVSGWNWDDENGTDGVSLDSGQITVPEDNTYYFSVMDRDSWGSIDQGSEYSLVPYTLTVTVTGN